MSDCTQLQALKYVLCMRINAGVRLQAVYIYRTAAKHSSSAIAVAAIVQAFRRLEQLLAIWAALKTSKLGEGLDTSAMYHWNLAVVSNM